MSPLASLSDRRRRRRDLAALDVARPDVSAGFGPADRLYFLHIHKTAGSTLARIIETHFGQGEICPAQTWQRFLDLPPASLRDYRLFRGHLLAFGHLLPARPWVVTFLRDPVERTLSTYDYIRRNRNHRLHRAALEMDLPAFLHDPDTVGTVRDLQTRWILANALPCENLKDADRRLAELGLDPLTTAQAQVDSYAFVGVVERFDASVERLMAVMGWHLFDWMTEHAGQRDNVSEERIRAEELTPAVHDRILELTALDRVLHERAVRAFDEGSTPTAHAETGPFSSTPSSSVDLDFSRAVPGFGWQMPETHPATGAGFRWIGPRPEASLFLALEPGRDLDLELVVQKAITPEVLAGLRLTVGDTDVVLTGVEGSDPIRLRGRVPAAAVASSEPTRLRFTAPSTASPASLGRAPDQRQLAVAFSRLTLVPST